MTHRERILAVLKYRDYDRLPLVHFGFWPETLERWAAEGHISWGQALNWRDGNVSDREVGELLGFDFNWSSAFSWDTGLRPPIAVQVLEESPDGTRKVLNGDGVTVIEKAGIVSPPTEVDYLLKGRAEWKEFFRPRLQFCDERIMHATVNVGATSLQFDSGGREFLNRSAPDLPRGLYCGSLLGAIRNWLGVVGMSYLQKDDPVLFEEIVATVSELCFQGVKAVLSAGIRFDYGHFWEDIAFKNGPLVNPKVFSAKVGPHYARITKLLREHGVEIVSVDCDGMIDRLIPAWVANGVNTMFPIEVGTWHASIGPWREEFGRELRGVGGLNKAVFAADFPAVEAELERLRPLVELGGYLPCPDHRIPPDAEWDNVRYYCERMRTVFG